MTDLTTTNSGGGAGGPGSPDSSVGAAGGTITETVVGGALPAASGAAPGTTQPDPGAAATTGTDASKATLVGDPAKKDEAPKAPEPIDATKFKLPDGFKADDAAVKEFVEFLGDATKSPQERAQGLLDLHANALKAASEASSKAWETTNDGWVKAVKADPEVGGANLEATRQGIAKAIDSLGEPGAKAFREGLNATGAGNHPGIIKGLNAFAKLLTEGKAITGNPPGRPVNIAEAFYPSMKQG